MIPLKYWVYTLQTIYKKPVPLTGNYARQI